LLPSRCYLVYLLTSSSLQTPPTPSPSALVAAVAAYHSSTQPVAKLATAAAGAALRNATISPPPPEQRTGSIPTKRMLKRRGSYSSITPNNNASSQRPGAIQRRSSSGSLTSRRFRKERLSPHPRDFRSHDSKRNLPGGDLYSLPITLREKTVKRTKSSSTMMNRGPFRVNAARPMSRPMSSGSEFSTLRVSRELGSASAITRGGEQGDSVTNMSSDLGGFNKDNIPAAKSQLQQRRQKIVAPELVPENEEMFDDCDGVGVGNVKTSTILEFKRPGKILTEKRLLQVSPSPSACGSTSSRAHFSDTTSNLIKHSPLPRAISPAKSALRRASSPLASTVAEHTSQDPASLANADRRRIGARVSFSDEDSIGSFSNMKSTVLSLEDIQRPPKLPTSSSVAHSSIREHDRRIVDRLRDSSVLQESAITDAFQESSPSDITCIVPWQCARSGGDFRDVQKERAALRPSNMPCALVSSQNIPEVKSVGPTPSEELEKECFTHSIAVGNSKCCLALSSEIHENRNELSATTQEVVPSSTPGSDLKATVSWRNELCFPDSGSDDESVYSDAFEELPSMSNAATMATIVSPLPSIAETLCYTELPTIDYAAETLRQRPPSPPPQSPASSHPSTPTQKLYKASLTNGNGNPKERGLYRPPSPPLPLDFSKPTPTPSRRRSLTPPPPKRRAYSSGWHQSSTEHPPTPPVSPRQAQRPCYEDSEESDASVSSFKRSYSRTSRPSGSGFRSSMRTNPPIDTAQTVRRYSSSSGSELDGNAGPRGRLGLGITLRKSSGGSAARQTLTWRSRFEDSSDDDDDMRSGSKNLRKKFLNRFSWGAPKTLCGKSPPASSKTLKKIGPVRTIVRPPTQEIIVMDQKKGLFKWRKIKNAMSKEKEKDKNRVQSQSEQIETEINLSPLSPSPQSQTKTLQMGNGKMGKHHAVNEEVFLTGGEGGPLPSFEPGTETVQLQVQKPAHRKKDEVGRKKGWQRLFGRGK
jgi:hypothetical protein